MLFQAFLENLDPFPGKTEKEITDYLWAKSIDIEPRQADKNDPLVKKRIFVSIDFSAKPLRVS